MEYKITRDQISKMLVENSMPTRQVFINEIMAMLRETVKTERKAFINGLRCTTCGKPMEFSPTADTCSKCFEEM